VANALRVASGHIDDFRFHLHSLTRGFLKAAATMLARDDGQLIAGAA
jgi:hypothetical protein